MSDKLMNIFPNLILRSPFNGIMSGKYAVIEFTGRKSGKQYRTPIAYVRQGNSLLMSTDSRWWRNLRAGAPVAVLLRGNWVRGTARAIEDPVRGAQILRALVDAIPSYAKPAELAVIDGRVSDTEITEAVTQRGRVSIEVQLAESAQ